MGRAPERAFPLDCVKELHRARTILERGSSAHWQVDTFNDATAGGADRVEALRAVVDMLVERTVADVAP